ncbi:MAG: hypothetical protein CO189_07930 [candidate division Zixibacteria bacterium CG_4_9_14_3_um_filter_46_8]|nr:MAG: hypothetical protein CO189_07930 [candidate division Zixibacteria bacterium CG_4_9_14_3_um_filter_46_8]
MNEVSLKSKSHLEFLAHLARLCSEYPASITSGDIAPLIAEQLPNCTVGLLFRWSANAEPAHSIAGDEEYQEITERIISEYCKSSGTIAGKDYQLEINNAEFTISGPKNVRVLCRGLLSGGQSYGMLIIVSSTHRKLSEAEIDIIGICSSLSASMAAREYAPSKPDYTSSMRISQSPRQTLIDLRNEICKLMQPSAVALCYLIPGEKDGELFFVDDDKSNSKSEFGGDFSIPRIQFDTRAIYTHGSRSLVGSELPQALVTELAKYDARELLFYPLRGKKEFYGSCIIGFPRKPDGGIERQIAEIMRSFQARFSASAALHLLIVSYKGLIDTEKIEIIKLTAATVNHHINNQLSVILGAAQLLLLKDKDDLPVDIRRKVEMIENNALRIKDLISSLRNIKDINIVEYMAGDKYLEIQ